MTSRETEKPPVLNATRARQGRFGRHIFWVLVFGTLLTALGMFAAWTWKSDDFARAGSGQETVSGVTSNQAPPPTPTRQAP